jgi:hypothetical protein
MIQLIAWIGAITGFLAAGIGLLAPVPAEKRRQTRRQGIIMLFVGGLGLILAIGMGRGVL